MTLLIGKEAPNFKAPTVMPDNSINNDFSLKEFAAGNKCVLLFYPLDFTFVCPTEIIALSHRVGEFASRGTKVAVISVDSHYTHLAWKNTPVNKGGIGNVQFPMVADLTKSIARDYGVLMNDAVAFRGTFLIDEDFVVRHQSINDLPLGRNIDEIIRYVDALSHFQQYGEVCPAGWNKGAAGMKANTEGVADYLTSNADKL